MVRCLLSTGKRANFMGKLIVWPPAINQHAKAKRRFVFAHQISDLGRQFWQAIPGLRGKRRIDRPPQGAL
jgi:hypothetical protein